MEVVNDNTAETLRLMRAAVKRGLEAVGKQAVGYAQALCPVDTGNLHNSLDSDADETMVVIGTNVEYAAYVEFGHRQNVGQYVPALGKRLKAPYVQERPYLRPAVENHVEEYKQMIEFYMQNA